MRSNGSVTDRKACDKFMNVLGDNVGSSCDMQQESVRLATTNGGTRINYFGSLVQPLIEKQQQAGDTLTIRTNTDDPAGTADTGTTEATVRD